MKHITALLIALMLLTGCAWAEETQSPSEPETQTPTLPAEGTADEAPAEPAEPAEPKKLVALTFDDGPDTLMTEPVLDILERFGVPATFFLQGNKINENTAALVERALSLGCEIGCHGWDHRNMMKVSLEMTQKQIRQYNGRVEECIHVPLSVMLVRPPGGHSGAKVKKAVGGMGMAIILWDVDSADWDTHEGQKIANNVLKRVKDGSIVLMHDRHQPTPDALEILIPALREQGYELVTVTELLTRNGGTVEPGVEYKCMPPAQDGAK